MQGPSSSSSDNLVKTLPRHVPQLSILPNSGNLLNEIVEGRLVLRHLDSGPEYEMVQDYVMVTDNGFPSCPGKLRTTVAVYRVNRVTETQRFDLTYGQQSNRMYLWFPVPFDEAADFLCNGIQTDEQPFYDTVSLAAYYAYQRGPLVNPFVDPNEKTATLLLCEVALNGMEMICQSWSDYKSLNVGVNIPGRDVVCCMGWWSKSCRSVSGDLVVPTGENVFNPEAYRTVGNYYPDYYVQNLDRIKIKYLVLLNGYTEQVNKRPPIVTIDQKTGN